MLNHLYLIELPYQDSPANDIYLLRNLFELQKTHNLNGGLISSKECGIPATQSYCGENRINITKVLLKTPEQSQEFYSNLSGEFAQTTDSFKISKKDITQILKENDFSIQEFP